MILGEYCLVMLLNDNCFEPYTDVLYTEKTLSPSINHISFKFKVARKGTVVLLLHRECDMIGKIAPHKLAFFSKWTLYFDDLDSKDCW